MEKNNLRNKNKQPSKLNLQSISIFNYYLKSYFPNLFQISNFPANKFVKLKATQRNITYNYVYQCCSGIEDVTNEAILSAANQVYSSMQGVSILDNGVVKKTVVKLPILPIWRQISEKIDILVMKQGSRDKEIRNRNFCSPHKIIKQTTNNTLQRKRSHPLISLHNLEQNKPKQVLQLFIIHHSSHSSSHSVFQWQNFVQRYKFESKCVDGENRPIITYQTVFAYNSEIKLDQSHKLLQIFFENSLFSDRNQNKLLNIEKIYSKLRNLVQLQKTKLKVQLQSVSFDQSHRRQLKLSHQQKIMFNNLKVKTFAYFSSLNRRRDINRYFLQNLICRMMGNRNYQQNQSWESIKYYLQFEKKMRDTYRWRDFQKYDKMNIFTYIGKDMMGRPILLNRIRNILCSKISNFDQFYYYHLYLFQIYMQDQMQGWVDQFVVIADASDQISDNTNLGFTKRLIFQLLKITIGRIYKLIACEVGFIGAALYKILKPLLPNSFTSCVKIFGDDKQEVLEELRLFISEQGIPEFLGGKNLSIDSNSGFSQERLNTERTNQSSTMLKNVKSLKNL